MIEQIKRIQSVLGVTVDGIAGPITWGAIEKAIIESGTQYIVDSSARHTTTYCDDRSERNIATLIPAAQDAARCWLLSCLDAGLRIKIIDGSRTYAEQNALYAQGRSKPGPVVTNSQAGYSWHNFGLAWDFGVFGPKGEYIEDGPDYTRAGEIAEAQGLEWGGRWKSPVDRPHVQLKTGLTLAQMRARVAAGMAVV